MINKIYVNLKKYFKENWKYLLIFIITVFITAIILFIDRLNTTDDNIKLKIKGPIKVLKQQDYDGKRVNLIKFIRRGNDASILNFFANSCCFC